MKMLVIGALGGTGRCVVRTGGSIRWINGNKKACARQALCYGAPGMIRTCDHLIRSQVLYPAELRVLKEVRIIYKPADIQSPFW
jgi:hypothetical protein